MTRKLNAFISNKNEIIVEFDTPCCENPKCDTVKHGRLFTIVPQSDQEIKDICSTLAKSFEIWMERNKE